MTHNPDLPRCGWVPPSDALYCKYHDEEWGVPIYDPKALFSKLIQDGMQAGLAWITILRKRETILEAFDGLDPDIIKNYTDKDRERLLNNPGIIRSKLKINAAIKNAKAFLQLQEEMGLSYVYVSQHMGVVKHFSDKVIVMQDGEVVEKGPTAEVFSSPQHSLTQKLLDSHFSAPTHDRTNRISKATPKIKC